MKFYLRLKHLMLPAVFVLAALSCKKDDFDHYHAMLIGKWEAVVELAGETDGAVQETTTYTFREDGTMDFRLERDGQQIVAETAVPYSVSGKKIYAANSNMRLDAVIESLNESELTLSFKDVYGAVRRDVLTRVTEESTL